MATINKMFELNNLLLLAELNYIDGVSVLRKYGRNPDIDGTAEDIADEGDVTWLTSAQTIFLSSTNSGDKGLKVLVQGLDANYLEVEEEITLDAVAPQTTAKESTVEFLRINRMFNTGAVQFAGDIYAGSTSTITVGVPQEDTLAKITYDAEIEHDQTLRAVYTIPANKTGFLFSYSPSTGRADDAEMVFQMKEFGNVWRTKHHFGVYQSAFQILMNWLKLPSKADVRLKADTSTTNMDVNGSFVILLIDNAYVK